MSVESRPNINAVGLLVDILKSIEIHARGNAKDMGMTSIITTVIPDIEEFVNRISDTLDNKFGR